MAKYGIDNISKSVTHHTAKPVDINMNQMLPHFKKVKWGCAVYVYVLCMHDSFDEYTGKYLLCRLPRHYYSKEVTTLCWKKNFFKRLMTAMCLQVCACAFHYVGLYFCINFWLFDYVWCVLNILRYGSMHSYNQ